MKRRVTLGDVARAVGVSMQTVSRAVNNKGEISPKTRERIMRAVQELGYRPNRLARAMSTQQTNLVGLIVPDITNPYFPEVMRGVQDKALANDYTVLACNSDDQPEAELGIIELLASHGVDGIITLSSKVREGILSKFVETFRPLVFVNRHFEHPHVSSVIVDKLQGAHLAVDHFVQEGHHRIGMITNKNYSFSVEPRVQGFWERLKYHNLEITEDQVIGSTPSAEGGFEATKSLLKRDKNITAIFAYNDLMALGALRACHDIGLSVPDDVSIIGFDDIQFAAMSSPALSSVRIDKYHIGGLALERMLDMIKHPEKTHPPINLGATLVLRESTRIVQHSPVG